MEWLADFTLYPCTWQASAELQQGMLDAVDTWVHDVWGKVGRSICLVTGGLPHRTIAP